MITAIVSVIEGPISSVISGCLGESGVWQMWPWNLVPIQVNMLSSDVSWELLSMLWCVRISVFLYYSSISRRAMVR